MSEFTAADDERRMALLGELAQKVMAKAIYDWFYESGYELPTEAQIAELLQALRTAMQPIVRELMALDN